MSIEFLEKYRDIAAAAMGMPTREKKIELITLSKILHSLVILYMTAAYEIDDIFDCCHEILGEIHDFKCSICTEESVDLVEDLIHGS